MSEMSAMDIDVTEVQNSGCLMSRCASDGLSADLMTDVVDWGHSTR